MRKKILKLEKLSGLLEPSVNERKEVRKKVIDYTETFLSKIEKASVFINKPDKGAALLASPISEKPIGIKRLIDLVSDNVVDNGLNAASGGHLGYIPGGGLYYSALGDYIADISNCYAGVFYASPGAVRMENMLIRWMAGLVGYPKTAVGNLTSGGSIANLIAIVAARDAYKLKSKDLDKTVIYLTEQAHHCINKAIRIAGLNECILRYIPVDGQYKMIPPALEKNIKADKKAGLKPWLVIASAGTTDLGAVDPLDQIGDIAKKHKLWYHIDAAYGGFFILTAHGKKVLKGIEKSDSVVMDPHKGLFIPYGLGVVLVKNKEPLNASHFYRANYMQDTLDANEEFSPADLSPELTKHFRGMRLWLPLKLHGVKPFRACLDEKLWLTRYFYEEVQKLGFEVGPKPELSVMTFRYNPKKGDANKFNEALVKEIQMDGKVFLSSTTINGKFILRFACLSFRTHLRTIDTLLQVLKEKVGN